MGESSTRSMLVKASNWNILVCCDLLGLCTMGIACFWHRHCMCMGLWGSFLGSGGGLACRVERAPSMFSRVCLHVSLLCTHIHIYA